MAVVFSLISGTAFPAWLEAFQPFLGQPILHGCELFNHLWNSLSCMGASQSSLGQPLLHGIVTFSIVSGTVYCELFNHPWDSLACMACDRKACMFSLLFFSNSLTSLTNMMTAQHTETTPKKFREPHQASSEASSDRRGHHQCRRLHLAPPRFEP